MYLQNRGERIDNFKYVVNHFFFRCCISPKLLKYLHHGAATMRRSKFVRHEAEFIFSRDEFAK
jgi:hypothetical protein